MSSQTTYLFGTTVIKIRHQAGVWSVTPHGEALGRGMAAMQHAFVGKKMIEIGTGTGIHAIAALKLGARVIDVTDIDSKVIALAQENAALNDVAFRNTWIRDWLAFEPPELYDFVLCNPPFCKAGTPDRRAFISAMIRESPRFLRPGGHLMFCQSSMANFPLTEKELREAGFHHTVAHTGRSIFRDYYFEEEGFIEESRRVENGFEEIDGEYVETLRVYLGTYTGHGEPEAE